MAGMTIIVKTASRLLFPFVLLFGIYIILHGHLTPGGGFPGGVVIVAAIVMLLLGYGADAAKAKFSPLQASVSENIGSLILVATGLLGLFLGFDFMKNAIPLGTTGNLYSSGIIIPLNIGVGIKVAAGLAVILYAMLTAFEEEKK
jgi:multicomponent Na+:H+ antiporter subunit B